MIWTHVFLFFIFGGFAGLVFFRSTAVSGFTRIWALGWFLFAMLVQGSIVIGEIGIHTLHWDPDSVAARSWFCDHPSAAADAAPDEPAVPNVELFN